MNWFRYLLIAITLAVTAGLTILFYNWSYEYKDTFSYSGDLLSYAMVFVFLFAIAGIFKWFLKEEIILTDPKRKRRRGR
jgi:hypothetical protein